MEGSTKQVTVNAYERNSAARQKCLDFHGYNCKVCDFDFAEVYGEIGKGFIHVHHIVQIANIKREYELDPVKDLVPLCPNCHAMVHRHNPAMHPDELRERLCQKNV
ncbi:restriction endonuclease [Vibrio parahaemolyticus]|nr:restriction endonuclease [Vibrio parahaemolyticus]